MSDKAVITCSLNGVLTDPMLRMFDTNGNVIGANDNWKSTQQAGIEAAGYGLTQDLESAYLATLGAGSYTVIVTGNNGSSGIGQVEVFTVE